MENSTVAIGLLLLLVLILLVECFSVKVYRFYRPDCPACVDSQDAWRALKVRCAFRLVRFHEIDMNRVDDRQKELFALLQGTTVPHVVKVHRDGRYYVYQGERTTDAYYAWLCGTQ